MKYNISIKNVQIQDVASIEGAEVNVEYGVGEIPEILSHLLPFIEKMAGEIAPKLANTFIDARLRLQREEEAIRKERSTSEIASLNKMGEILKELEESNHKSQVLPDAFPESPSPEDILGEYLARYRRHG